MLDQNVFLMGLVYISKSYIKWDFDFSNKELISHWYSFFKDFKDQDFRNLIKGYCISETFAPNSVASLFNFWKSQKLEKELLPHSAWDTVVELIHVYGFNKVDKIYGELVKYPVLRKTFWEFESTLRILQKGDNYTAQRFQEAYKENLKRAINEEQKQQLENILISKDQKLIEKGGNDNECN